MKVAITGSAGFIGSNLTSKCLSMGWDVIGIDNFSTGHKGLANSERYCYWPKYVFYEQDITNTVAMETMFKGCDVVFHMAALPRVQYSTDYPVESNHNNVDGTVSVLEAARKVGVGRVVYSASSSMYGGSDIPFPTPETTQAHPRSNYALQKYVGLEYCRLYSELYGLDTVSLIYYNVFGPNQFTGGAYSSVIPAFIEAGIKGQSCRIDGTGLHTRDFCYVDNVVQANFLAAIHSNKLMGEAFNIACGDTTTVNEVFDEVQNLLGKPLNKLQAPARLGDPAKSLADISKARSVLGYDPKVRFKEGMEKTVSWWLKGCPI